MTTSDLLSPGEAEAARPWALPVFETADSGWSATLATPHSAQHLDELEKAASDDGFARGHAEGFAAGLAEARAQADQVKALLGHLSRPLKELDSEVERALVALTIEMARRLAHLEMDLDPTRVASVVREAVGALGSAPRDVRIRLHPHDAAAIRPLLSLPDEVHDWKLVADPELNRGDCRIEADGVRVDARLDTRQAVIAQALLGENA